MTLKTENSKHLNVGVKMKKAMGLLFMVVLATGCEVEKVGNDGVLSMYYAHGLLENTTRPIGVGLVADVGIRDSITDAQGSILDVQSSDSTVLSVQSMSTESFQLQGEQAGTSLISVESDLGADSFDLTTMDVEAAVFGEIVHGVDGNVAAYPVAGSKFAIDRELYGSNQTPITGYGWDGFTVGPAELVTFLEDSVMEVLWFQTLDKGNMIVEFGYHSKSIQILDPSEITNWVIDMPEFAEGDVLPVGQGITITIYGETAEAYVGLTNLISEDETVCSVDSFWDVASLYIVSPLSNGLCRISNIATGDIILALEVAQ